MIVSQKMATGIDSFPLLAIPFFILSGLLMGKGGIARRLIDFANVLVGRFIGGLAYMNILACMFFGAISGSATAATSSIGSFMIPLMNDEGYEKEFSASITMTAATTGLVIPPSNIMIIYSLAAGGVSVASLFLAGYLPGIIIGLCLMIPAGIISKRRKYPSSRRFTLKEALIRFRRAILSLLLIIIVIGGIIKGIFTATEAAVIAVIYSALLSVAIYREVKLSELPQILLQSSITTAIIMILIAASSAMSWLMTRAQIPQTITEALLSLTDNKYLLLAIINFILLFVGCFMDMTPAVLIFTPILLPIAAKLQIHPIHFGIIMIVNLCIGLCTPPVGSILFVGCSIAKTTIAKIVRPIIPFFISMLLSLIIITYLPSKVIMFLPNLFGFN